MNISQIGTPRLNPIEVGELQIDRRIDRIEKRIELGIAKGDLSEEESTRLLESLEAIKETYALAKEQHNGKLTPADRREINRSLHELSRQVFGARHLEPEPLPID
jgi:hypothetical protein